MQSRRAFLLSTGAVAVAGTSCRVRMPSEAFCGDGGVSEGYALAADGSLRLTVRGLEDIIRVRIIGDTHLALHDGRDDAFRDDFRRMAQWPAKKDAFEQVMLKTKEERPDILLLVGDNISFPTFANIEYLKSKLDETGVDWYYVAGNHDWHFEGQPGSDENQRGEWIRKRLLPLYQGCDPLMSSRLVKGVRFLAVDNSIYHVSPVQLGFFRAEIAKGDPTILFMHIPLWLPEWGVHTCGCPDWGAARDTYWKIERRERWAQRQSPSTFAFRDAVLSSPNLIGVFTGHIHRLMLAQERGKFMLSVPSNRDGAVVDVRLCGTAFP